MAGVNPVPEPESGARVTVRGKRRAWFLPFLGETREIPGVANGATTTFALPPIGRGAVVWLEESGK